MSKFKVGDKVITRKFDQNPPGWDPDMSEFDGKIGVVDASNSTRKHEWLYVHHRKDGGYWCWPESALELVLEEETIEIPGVGKVTLKLKGVTA